jgi:valyl-tRNA synthetase
LNKELSNIKDEIEIIGKRLDNPEFVNKAPPKVVKEVKEKQGIYKKKKEEIEKALISL